MDWVFFLIKEGGQGAFFKGKYGIEIGGNTIESVEGYAYKFDEK